MSAARDYLATVQQRADAATPQLGDALATKRLVAALTAALDLCDDPGGPDSWSHMFQGRQSVFVDDIRAAIADALTPKENDS